MRTASDLASLFRSSVGFDRVFDLLENAARIEPTDGWPPYDIRKTGEDHYAITMAVAGFRSEQLSVTFEPGMLVVRGTAVDDRGVQYLYRGMSGGNFEHRFELADHVKATRSSLDHGLLTIELVREMPEALKPRRIEIQSDRALATGPRQPQQTEQQKAAA
jgi:molecular chaperone IbpA